MNWKKWVCLGMVLVGNLLYALSVKLFVLPANLMSCGTTGIALVVRELTGLPVSRFVLGFNLVMLGLGWWVLGRQFAMTTILSSLLFVLWGVFGTKAFIRQFSQDEAIVAYGTTYLKICQIFAAGIFLGTFTQRLLQSPPAGPSPVCWRRWRALWPSL